VKFGRVPSTAMLSALSLEAKGLYGIICVLCGNRSYCYPRVSYLVEVSGRSKPTVYRLLRELGEAGAILRYMDTRKNMTITLNLLDPACALGPGQGGA
jgi:pyocin large subunit-like protein